MNSEEAIRKTPLAVLVLSSILFLVVVFLILMSKEEVTSVFGSYSFWQISIYEKMAQTMEVYFGALCLLQLALYLSTRHAAAKGITTENLKMRIAGTYSVALSAWLMYATFYGLAPASVSVSVKLTLSAFLAYTVVVGLQTYCEVCHTGIVALIRNLMKKYAPALVLFAVGIALYLSFVSCSLSEWDSFNFAQALERFDLGSHQPHPPGYALYVLLSRLASLVAGSGLLGLTSVSAISGALCLLPVYAIVRKMYDHETALVTGFALMSTRMFWLTSEKAVTHMFGTFLMTLAICFLYLGLKGELKFYLMSWPLVGIALGARPSYFPFLGLWLYATLRERDLRKLPMHVTLLSCSVLSWFVPKVLLTGWERFWELIRRQYVYVSVNEFVGARYGMQPVERLLFMLGKFLSCGFGAPTWLWFSPSRPFGLQDAPPVIILCLLVGLAILGVAPKLRRKWNSKRTFLVLWIVPYFIAVYLTSTPGYPRYFLPIIPPIIIAVVSTAWSTARSIKSSSGQLNLRKGLLFCLVAALIFFNFLHSSRLAATIHTTEVPMVRLARHIKSNCGRNTVVIVFHEFEALEYHPPGCRYLSAQYHRNQVVEILENLSKKNQKVLVTDTSIRYVLASTIERLGLKMIEVARFEIDPQVETEQHIIVLYELQPANSLSQRS